MTAYKLLVADDEFWVRENLRSLLTDEEGTYQILEPAVDGESALNRIGLEKPDVLITDIDMPFLNGNELIRAARSRWPELQVIVLSGYADFEYVRQALLDGAVDYLLKPVTKEALLQVVGRAVSNLRGRLTREQEWSEQTKTLQRAASLLRDEALSALLQETPPPQAPRNQMAELDFEFAVYTLLLVKLIDQAQAVRNQEEEQWVAKVKALATRESAGPGKTLVFHNISVRNEFLVLTDRDSAGVDHLGIRLAENLERFTGSRVDVAVSPSFYSFDKLCRAYREAKAALLTRTAGDPDRLVKFESVCHREVRGRLTPELEHLLTFAADSENKSLIREVVFDKIGLRTAQDWLLVEVKQTIEFLAGRIFPPVQKRSAVRSALAFEAFQSLLTQALESRDLDRVCALLDQWIDEVFAGVRPGTSASMKQTVRRVQDYIAEKYSRNLSLANLAQVFQVEGSYLSKAFRQVTGSTLVGTIAQTRIEKAEEYIRDRDLSLTEVASLVGYEEYAYFNRVFRKIAGISPSDYKNRHRREVHEPR